MCPHPTSKTSTLDWSFLSSSCPALALAEYLPEHVHSYRTAACKLGKAKWVTLLGMVTRESSSAAGGPGSAGRSARCPLLSRPLGKPERTRPGGAFGLVRNFHFELPLHPKTYASYPVVSTANSSGLFEVVVGHILAVLRSRCAGFACPACLAADTDPARPLLST